MIDFGIVSLLIMQLFLTIACGAAFLSIRRENNVLENAKYELKTADEKATKALNQIDNLDKEQYQALVKRIFAIESIVEKWGRTFGDYLEEFKSLSTRVSALKRWDKKEPREKGNLLPDEGQEAVMDPAEIGQPLHPNQTEMFPNFGKKARKAG